MDIEYILKNYKNIAVIGLSGKKDRYSYIVADYLLRNGYNIIPVNPNINEWNGIKAYKNVKSIDKNIDVIDIFRKPEFVNEIVNESIGKAKVIWMQEGIINNDAKIIAENNNMYVIMDKCIKKEHEKLNNVK